MKQLMLLFSQMQSQQPHPVEPNVASFGARVRIKGNCVDPSRQDPDIDISDMHWLYVDDILPYLVFLGKVYEGSSIVHHVPLANDMVKVGVEEIRDVDACDLTPTKKVQLVGQALYTFIVWPKHLVKPFSYKVFPFCCVYYY